MRRNVISKLERQSFAGWDAWRDKWFCYGLSREDPEVDAELEKWRADFPDREPKILRLVCVKPEEVNDDQV